MKIQYTISREDFSEINRLVFDNQFQKWAKYFLIIGAFLLLAQMYILFVDPENLNPMGWALGTAFYFLGTAFLKNKKVKRIFWGLFIGYVVICFVKKVNFDNIDSTQIITFAIPLALFGGLWYFIFRKFKGRDIGLSVMEKQAGKQLYPKQVELDIEKDVVVSTSDGIESKIRWEDFDFYRETEKWVLIVKTGAYPISIPKSAVNHENLGQILDWVRAKVKLKN